MHKCVPYFSQSSNESKRQSSKTNFCFIGISIVWPCSLFLCQCSSDKWIKTPKSWNLISVLSYLSVLSDFDCTTLFFISLSVFLKLMNQTPKSSNLDSCFIWVAIARAFSQRSLCCILIVHQFSINRDRHLFSSISHEFEIAFNFLTTSPPWHSLFSPPLLLVCCQLSGIITHTILSCHIGGKYYPLKPSEPSVCFGQ